MENNIYKEALENISSAFAYHKAIFDDKGKMVDYEFLHVNKSFEDLTGLKRKNIINKRLVRDIEKENKEANSWVDIYEKVILDGLLVEFEKYSDITKCVYTIKAYPVGKEHFVTVFNDKTFHVKIQEIGQYFIDNIGQKMDYDRITEFTQDVSGAKYVVFNLFSETEDHFTTVAIRGLSKKTKKWEALLGFDIVGKKWAYDPNKEEQTKGKAITYFNSLKDLTGNVLPVFIVSNIEKALGIGNVVVTKIFEEEKVLGDFTLVFKRGQSLKNEDLLKLYLSQLGLFIEKNRLDNALKANQRMMLTLAEFAPFGFLSCNTKGEILYANQRLIEIMDSPSVEATKAINLMKVDRLIEIGFSSKLSECMEENEAITYETEYTSLWGRHSWLRVHFTPYVDEVSVIGANIIIEDITDKKKYEEELQDKANRDPLTRTYNRNVLSTILKNRLAISDKENLVSCIGAIDIDNFKDVNDNYGHGVGDSVLKHVAVRIKEILKEDDLIVRTGGDEFLFYLHNVESKEKASDLVRDIFGVISENYHFENTMDGKNISLNICFSIGLALYPSDGKTVETLMKKADKALYRVKNSGKCDYAFV